MLRSFSLSSQQVEQTNHAKMKPPKCLQYNLISLLLMNIEILNEKNKMQNICHKNGLQCHQLIDYDGKMREKKSHTTATITTNWKT